VPDQPFDTGLAPDELDLERPHPIDTPWGKFAIFDRGDALVAVECWCPHLQGPLFEGSRFQGHGSGAELTCPWHAWRFSLVDGHCAWAPEGADRSARVRLLRVEFGEAGTVLLHPPGE
jgi:nitrite reductase/ring-hydroxylating ferredoxin subunit